MFQDLIYFFNPFTDPKNDQKFQSDISPWKLDKTFYV